jgi:hypothetical protein
MSKSFDSIFYVICRTNVVIDHSLFIDKIDFGERRVLFGIFSKEF